MRHSHSLLGRLAEHFRAQPASVALVAGTEQTTYGELAEMAGSARAYLEELALPAGVPVAVQAGKSPQTIALAIACLMTRRPCLLPSTELGPTALGALLDRAGCHALLTATPAARAGISISHTACAPAGQDGVHPLATQAAFLLTTSGSTGLPKIVPLGAAAVDRFTAWAAGQFDMEPGTTVLNYAPLSFDLCLLDIWATLSAGGTVVLVPQERATDGRYLAECVRGQRVSVIQSVPMFYRLLADAYGGERFGGVRYVITTGDKLPARLLTELPELFPGARVYNLYGCTETNDSFLYEVTEFDGRTSLPIGRPLPGVDAVICDEDGEVLEGPADGELLVRTPFQTAGYVGPDGAGKFVAVGGGRYPFFRSGDRVRRDEDGGYELLGRYDFQVKIRGTRVNLAEIEQVLLGHDQVTEAAVIAAPDDTGESRLHAMIRGADAGSVNSLALRDHCRLRLVRAAIPSTIKIVDHPLPTTPTGKVDRQAIRHTVLSRS